jgi:hypothetical protein
MDRVRTGQNPAKALARFRPCLEAMEDRQAPAILTVTTTAYDLSPGSILSVINQSNASPEHDTIVFDPQVFSTAKTIQLTNWGEMPISNGVTITGPAAGLTLDAMHLGNRIFNIFAPGIQVQISNLTLTRGAMFSGGAIHNVANLTLTNCTLTNNLSSIVFPNDGVNFQAAGGAINNAGTLTVNNCTFTNNIGEVAGGAIYNTGSLTVSGSAFTGNASGLGGAIHNGDRNGFPVGAQLTVSNSTFAANAAAYGGGILNQNAPATVTGCTLSEQLAIYQAVLGGKNYKLGLVDGGGIYNAGPMTLGNCTFFRNVGGTGYGSAIYNKSQLTVINATITNNSAGKGAIWTSNDVGAATTLHNSIVADNFVSNQNWYVMVPDLAGNNVQATSSNNLIGNASSAGGLVDGVNGNMVGRTANLGPLQNNGGPTLTCMPLSTSPALNAGNSSVAAAAGLTTDQRGLPRVVGAAVDIGAVERSTPAPIPPAALVVSTLADTVDDDFGPGQLSLREAVQIANARLQPDVITFAPEISGGVITLAGTQLSVSHGSLAINGPAAGMTISGNNASRVLRVARDAQLDLDSLTITQGRLTTKLSAEGAGLDNFGSVTVTNCTIIDNEAKDAGGGIANRGTMTITNCTVTGNRTGGLAGGILTGNEDPLLGAATMMIRNCTVSANEGVNIYNASLGSLTLTNSIVATAIPNTLGVARQIQFSSGFETGSHNVIAPYTIYGDDSGLTNTIKANAMLGPLGNNGGPTQTFALLVGSPAFDNGSNDLVPVGITTDQRGTGFSRVSGPRVDIGAYESQQIVVTNNADSGPGSLRAAITLATSNPWIDNIVFDPTFFSVPRTIALTSGELVIADSVNIIGPSGGVTISGGNARRVFNLDINGTGTVGMSDVTITYGKAAGGAGILANDDNLTLIRCTVSNNTSTDPTYQGGGVSTGQNAGTWTFTDCTFSGNTGGRGGAIYFFTGGTLNMNGCTVSGNKANDGNGGGGLYNYSNTATIINSTFSGNQSAGSAGAIQIYYTANVTIRNSTITGNTATGRGGGINVVSDSLTISSSIIAGNSAGTAATNDVAAPSSLPLAVPGDNNLIGVMDAANYVSLTGTGNLVGATAAPLDAKLGPLADNGGRTMTHALLSDSPAIDKGNNVANLDTDQRGTSFGRVVGAPDIGAYEDQLIVVINNADSGPGSLRAAIARANFHPWPDNIVFDPTFFSVPRTIALTSGELLITEPVNIIGPSGGVTISGSNASRVFNLEIPSTGTVVMMSDLTITNGKAASGAGIHALNNDLTLNRCTISNNTSTDPTFHGGGVSTVSQFAGTWSFTDCTFSGNTGARAGAIFFLNGGTLLMTACTVLGNKANHIQGGGAIYGRSSYASIINSTFSGNQALNGSGGAIRLLSDMTIRNSTITGNTAAVSGGGIRRDYGNLTLISTIVSGNTAATASSSDLASNNPFTVSGDNNLIGVMDAANNVLLTGAGNLVGTTAAPLDAKLGPLADNGGRTMTHALLPDSPAIDKGNNVANLTTDQRGTGFSRVSGGSVDIGAYEDQLLFVVTNDADNGPGSLRAAIAAANAEPGSDTIVFAPAYFSVPRTITLTNGELTITDSVTIAGPESGVTISGTNASRVFNLAIPGTGNVTMTDLTISDGKANGGAGILANDDNLTLTRCTVSNNTSTDPNYQGGGVSTGQDAGTWTFTDCTFSGNTGGRGGAIYFFTGGTLNMMACTVSGNKATDSNGGGGLYNYRNTATIINSTFSGNQSAGAGGAIQVYYTANVTIRNSTITGNTATGRGGGVNVVSGSLTISSSIIAGNSAGTAATSDVAALGPLPLTVAGDNNLIGVMDAANSVALTGVGNLTGTKAAPLNAKLGPLANNGGRTQTHALLPGSPAINAGNNLLGLPFDQRGSGFNRVVGPTDIGAFEVHQPAKVTSLQVNDGSPQRSRVTSLTITFDNAPTLPINPADGFQLQRQSDSQIVSLIANVSGNSVTLTFAGGPLDFGSLADGRYTLTAWASKILNLDGNGDGVFGDDYQLVGTPANGLFRLFGDADGNALVNAEDFLQFRNAFGFTGPSIFDFNNDNFTGAADFAEFRVRFGTSLIP